MAKNIKHNKYILQNLIGTIAYNSIYHCTYLRSCNLKNKNALK